MQHAAICPGLRQCLLLFRDVMGLVDNSTTQPPTSELAAEALRLLRVNGSRAWHDIYVSQERSLKGWNTRT
ncbi:hypothetical protein CYMTET_26180 [Cymbomonas tetramitiformis]|uniref:Uncharacterized protein n=1 Tax=Cymbomonas tetramitiformis TaxID=36881 RepID=A0AAE0FT33_9CHLO|nr:hypothetical protein CYMTET_26180 [Cymbomonas tetramitiformis]